MVLSGLRRQIREGLLDHVRCAVSATAHQLVEDEVVSLVGEPWSRKGESPLRRNGHTETTIFLDGEPRMLRRARVRDRDVGSEYPLQTLRALRSRDALDEDVKTRLVRGISTRNYEGALTSLSEGLGLKKSAVSSAFRRASKKDLDPSTVALSRSGPSRRSTSMARASRITPARRSGHREGRNEADPGCARRSHGKRRARA